MPHIYMRHPIHGEMIYSSPLEVSAARASGWEEYDPTVRVEAPQDPTEGVPVAPVAQVVPEAAREVVPAFLMSPTAPIVEPSKPKPKK